MTTRKKSRTKRGKLKQNIVKKKKQKTYSSHYAKKCQRRKKSMVRKRYVKRKVKNDSEFEQRIEEIENNITRLNKNQKNKVYKTLTKSKKYASTKKFYKKYQDKRKYQYPMMTIVIVDR